MKLLEDRILAEGNVLSPAILKVDSFINHQVDPVLMQEMGRDIANHFKDQGVTKVMTCLLYTSCGSLLLAYLYFNIIFRNLNPLFL